MKILVLEQHPICRTILCDQALKLGLDCICAKSSNSPCALVEEHNPDIAWLDYESARKSNFLVNVLDRLPPSRPVVITLPHKGIIDDHFARTTSVPILLLKPYARDTIRETLKYLLSHYFSGRHEPGDYSRLIGISSQIRDIKHKIVQLAKFTFPVLIFGETGTGKELLASALHAANQARKGPFVAVDCGALSPSLLETELFGHTKGAYTGADRSSRGLVQQANGGTVFLDEIGELPLDAQCKLLRVIQEREVRPVGSTQTLPVDIRILAATNQDLRVAVRERRFRNDLYFRLSAFTLDLPPLRERVDDIPFLAHDFAASQGITKPLSIDAVGSLMEHSWPGNIRELQNALLRAWTLADAKVITANEFVHMTNSFAAGAPEARNSFEQATPKTDSPETPPLDSLAECEKSHIMRVLAHSDGHRLEAARRLGIGKTTLYRKLKLYGKTG